MKEYGPNGHPLGVEIARRLARHPSSYALYSHNAIRPYICSRSSTTVFSLP